MATVKFFGNLRTQVGSSHLQISGENVRALLDLLIETTPSLDNVILKDGTLRPFFKIMVNGHDISLAQGLDTPVSENDQVAIFPPIAGG